MDPKATVRERRVFYIPGYDPFHPRRYRELYRAESAKQAAISGYDMSLKGRHGGAYGWDVASCQDGIETHSFFEVLVWSDIVRGSMQHGILATYGQLLRTAGVYISTGALWRLSKLRKGPVIAALYPVGVLLLQLLVAWLIARAVLLALVALPVLIWGVDPGNGIVSALSGITMRALPGGGGPWVLAMWSAVFWGLLCALQLAIIWAVLRWFRSHDNRFFAYYLMHDYAFSARWRGADPPALSARVDRFAERIAEALASDVDEVLVVGHSSGAHIAVTALARLIAQGRVPKDGPALGFLSLGQVVPMVSFLPEARGLRRDLAFLSAREELFWLDVTAPGDGCAFALCDPVAVSGVAPRDQKWPRVISAAFTQTLAPETWSKLKRRYFRLHFQYLCAFDRPGDYDYFRITAGPQRLADRFADRAPSPGTISTPASGYRDT